MDNIDKQPLISIIIVVLNMRESLEIAICSVLKQDFDDYEFIIIDGASTDGTVDIIRKYEKSFSYWISQPDEGVYDAMDKAISKSTGKWLYFLGADDFLLCSLERIASYLVEENAIYYGNVYRPEARRNYDGKFSPYKLACRNICQQSIFYPRSVFKKYKYNEKYLMLADYELNMRCFSDPDFSFKYFPEVIACFNDKGGLSPSGDYIFEIDRIELVKRNFDRWIYFLVRLRFWLINSIFPKLGILGFCKKKYHFLLQVRDILGKYK